MVDVLFTEAAQADLEDAIAWYDAQSPGMTPHLLAEFTRSVDRVAEDPKEFPVIPQGTRRALMRRFPYSLIFREHGGAVYVVAIFRARRRPTIWQSRLP